MKQQHTCRHAVEVRAAESAADAARVATFLASSFLAEARSWRPLISTLVPPGAVPRQQALGQACATLGCRKLDTGKPSANTVQTAPAPAQVRGAGLTPAQWIELESEELGSNPQHWQHIGAPAGTPPACWCACGSPRAAAISQADTLLSKSLIFTQVSPIASWWTTATCTALEEPAQSICRMASCREVRRAEKVLGPCRPGMRGRKPAGRGRAEVSGRSGTTAQPLAGTVLPVHGWDARFLRDARSLAAAQGLAAVTQSCIAI